METVCHCIQFREIQDTISTKVIFGRTERKHIPYVVVHTECKHIPYVVVHNHNCVPTQLF